ncbi:MAG: hypothetical protein QXN68_00520 [Thermoplasmata archaeon]
MNEEHDKMCLDLAVRLNDLGMIYVSVFKRFRFKDLEGEIDICGYNLKDGSYLLFEIKSGKSSDEKARIQLLKAMGYIYKFELEDYIKAYYVCKDGFKIEFLYKDGVLKDYKYKTEYHSKRLDVLIYNLLQNEKYIR